MHKCLRSKKIQVVTLFKTPKTSSLSGEPVNSLQWKTAGGFS